MIAVKRILRYVKGTMNFGILYKKQIGNDQNKDELIGFTYAGDIDDRKSTS